MDIVTKSILNKIDKAYDTIEKYSKKYPGARGYVVIECADFGTEITRKLSAFYRIGILKDSTHIVLDENKKQIYDIRKQKVAEGKCLAVYDMDYDKVGTITKQENMFRSEKVTIEKYERVIGSINADNSTDINNISIKHSLLGFNYEIYKNGKLAMFKKNENEVSVLMMMEDAKEAEGLLIAAGMRLLHKHALKP